MLLIKNDEQSKKKFLHTKNVMKSYENIHKNKDGQDDLKIADYLNSSELEKLIFFCSNHH